MRRCRFSRWPIICSSGSSEISQSSIPVEVSQAALTIIFVALGMVFMGVGFARSSKTKDSLKQHRWILTVAVMLTLGTIISVMLPSTFNHFIDPALETSSALSIGSLAHGVVCSLGLLFL